MDVVLKCPSSMYCQDPYLWITHEKGTSDLVLGHCFTWKDIKINMNKNRLYINRVGSTGREWGDVSTTTPPPTSMKFSFFFCSRFLQHVSFRTGEYFVPSTITLSYPHHHQNFLEPPMDIKYEYAMLLLNHNHLTTCSLKWWNVNITL